MPLNRTDSANRLGGGPAAGTGVAGGSKIRSLSRQWSTNNAAGPQSSQPTWEANADEWPVSPPRKKTVVAASGVGGGWRANGGTRPSGQGLPGSALPPAYTASSFTAASGKAFGGSHQPRATGSSSASLAVKTSASSAVTSKPKAKREFPWDNPGRFNNGPSKTATSSGSGSFRSLDSHVTKKIKLGGVSSSAHLTNPNMSIASKVTLSPEQRAVLSLVMSGQSVFFTGSAGTGKSVLLRQIIKDLRNKHVKRPDAVAVTASTGMAACNIGGTTIHSFAGIGLGNEKPEELVRKVMMNRKASSRWKRTLVLVIDEVSMVDGDLFDKLDFIGRKLGKAFDKPFGGMQLVITGDFFQLPPVSRGQPNFCFNARSWISAIQATINLTQVFRQTDTTFVDMLNEMRMGELSSRTIERFRALSRAPEYNDGIDPTELYPSREEVARSNEARLAALTGQTQVYEAVDSGKGTPEQRKRDTTNMMAVDRLTLKVDAQVMMIKNVSGDEGPSYLVNGAVGKVVDFVDERTTISEWKERNDGVPAAIKAAGAGDQFQWTDEDIKPRVKKENAGRAAGPGNMLPVVRWFLAGGQTDCTIVARAEFKVENAEGEVQTRRVQLPLILAWAMSIHKSQGQTLDRVKVDLGRVFEKGQSYVALSRATSLEGLQVLRFDPRKVMAHEKVIEWSKNNLTSAL